MFGEKRLYSSKCGCVRARRLYLGKVVVFVQSGSIRARWL